MARLIVGQAIGRWTLIERRRRNRRSYWLCRCACGNIREVCSSNLTSTKSASCGCIRTEANVRNFRRHGLAGTAVYHVWQNMLKRCENPSSPKYPDYGARGITVCERWHSFENFLSDMGMPPSREHQLDRRNNDGDYEPGNCRWATRQEQARNKRNNALVTFNGVTRTLPEWAERLGINQATLRERLTKWSLEEALTKPKQH